MRRKGLEEEIEQIQEKLAGLGRLRPGRLYKRYTVCGKPSCHCAPDNGGVKHGPYWHLHYTLDGKGCTEFVSEADVRRVRVEIWRYRRLMGLVKDLIRKNVELAKKTKEER